MRGEGLEDLITKRKQKGRIGRGRQREQTTYILAAWMNIDKTKSVTSATRDRRVWKDMIANAVRQGT